MVVSRHNNQPNRNGTAAGGQWSGTGNGNAHGVSYDQHTVNHDGIQPQQQSTN
jgi:hypothetical protein